MSEVFVQGMPQGERPRRHLRRVRRRVRDPRGPDSEKGPDYYKEKIDKKRVLLKKKPIDYVGMKTNVHQTMAWGEDMMDLIDSLAGEDFPLPRRICRRIGATEVNFNGTRRAFFEARDESNQRVDSSLRMGTY